MPPSSASVRPIACAIATNVVLGVHVCPLLEEQLHDAPMPILRGNHECREAMLVGHVGVGERVAQGGGDRGRVASPRCGN